MSVFVVAVDAHAGLVSAYSSRKKALEAGHDDDDVIEATIDADVQAEPCASRVISMRGPIDLIATSEERERWTAEPSPLEHKGWKSRLIWDWEHFAAVRKMAVHGNDGPCAGALRRYEAAIADHGANPNSPEVISAFENALFMAPAPYRELGSIFDKAW